MSRLFVDIDHTLVTWLGGSEPHPYGHGAETWEWNEKVVRAILEHEGLVIIWSGGGVDYARGWTLKFLNANPSAVLLIDYGCKQPIELQPGDHFIDDSPCDAWKHLNTYPKDLK